ncbi:ATP-binding Cassette (ABC) superfamily [Phytophthora infestans T30-4]|uniref:ATP-binding Cassette (ABC) superfamily n=1 Tax=Phytophthora infestans (strain T30-4) TaxID=403677 RepID=D0NDM2_PHYIT|nr:ATP-binding Cassette (ABC) superfamily [Phytophthora infestans T30-4]EEY56179.1 ATP-binding Cassette (ABC) superfamily [Phytophthora infestans T30-4]|eukprot:XP_002903009.1 ATP-binding Cassette (ABC) superfamily [Phytophthora infestans T30-4]
MMDEISTGLDSAATFDIIVMMLNEGRVMYYGPGEEALGYFEGLGFKRPPQRDVADFLMDLVMGLLYGCVFYQVDPTDPQLVMGVIFEAALCLSMIPAIVEARDVFYKQRCAKFFEQDEELDRNTSNWVDHVNVGPPAAALPEGVKWIYTISLLTYSLSALTTVVFGDCPSGNSNAIGCRSMQNVPPTLPSGITVKKNLEVDFSMDHSEIWRNFGVLLAFVIFVRGLTILAMRFLNHQKK